MITVIAENIGFLQENGVVNVDGAIFAANEALKKSGFVLIRVFNLL